MRIPERDLEHLLDTWPVARLATVGPERTPHVVPIAFARAGGLLWTPIDGKPKGAGQLARVTHIRDVPRVSLLLDAYEADWTRLWWIRVDGSACIVTSPDPEAEPATAAAVAALRAKYPQYATTPLFRGVPTLIRIRVTALRSWRAAAHAAG